MNAKSIKDQYINQIHKELECPSKFIRNLIRNQMKLLQSIKNTLLSKGISSNNTFFEQVPFHYDNYCNSSKDIINQIPIDIIRNDFTQMVVNHPFYSLRECHVMNIGKRIHEPNSSIAIDEWCNVINENNPDEKAFSIHKSFDTTHYSIRNSNSSRVLEIYFNESFAQGELNKLRAMNENPNALNELIIMEPSCSVYYMYYCNEITHKYKIAKTSNSEITIEHSIDNKPEQERINKTKRIVSKGQSCQSQSVFIRTKGDYKEVKEIEKTINEGGESFGKKKFDNSCNRKYFEEWKRNNFETGFELKVHSFLDDGLGKKVTKDFGNRKENDNEVFNYCDTFTEETASGDTTLIREGRDLMNEWHCFTTSNKLKNTELTENKARNFKDCLEWYEKWYKTVEENYAKKWGKSIYEEWEEDWNEVIENGETVRKCNKKCKRLLEDKQWEESWTEKKGDEDETEKTCYKMNRIGNEKYEHYWGDIKLNYLDNKRMNYDGFIINDTEKHEYKNYY